MQSKQRRILPNVNKLLQPSLKLQPLILPIQRRLHKYGITLSEVDVRFHHANNLAKRVKAFTDLSHAKTYYQAKVFDIDPSLLIDEMFNGKSYSWQSVFAQSLINDYFNALQYPEIPYRIVIHKTINNMTLLFQYNYTIDKLLPLHHQNHLLEVSKIASEFISRQHIDNLRTFHQFAYSHISNIESLQATIKSNSSCFADENLIDFYNELTHDEKLLPLSNKQKEIAKLAYEGYTTKEIAYKLNIAQSTATEYLNTVKLKLGADSKSALIQRLHHLSFLFSA